MRLDEKKPYSRDLFIIIYLGEIAYKVIFFRKLETTI